MDITKVHEDAIKYGKGFIVQDINGSSVVRYKEVFSLPSLSIEEAVRLAIKNPSEEGL